MKFPTQQLLDLALEQLNQDVANEDLTALEELIRFVPEERLVSFLPDEAFEEQAQ